MNLIERGKRIEFLGQKIFNTKDYTEDEMREYECLVHDVVDNCRFEYCTAPWGQMPDTRKVTEELQMQIPSLTLQRNTHSYHVYKDNTRQAGTIVYVPRDTGEPPAAIVVTIEASHVNPER